MIYKLIITFIFIFELNFFKSVIETQSLKLGYFDIILKMKDLPTNSANLIKSSEIEHEILCLFACNRNFLCTIVIYNSNGWCTLCKLEALNELIDSDVGQKTTVYRSQKQISNILNGLTNYWPIVNDLRDYIGLADISTGPLDPGETIGFSQDRFNNPNGVIYMNPGYYILPPGIYFENSFSFLIWVKVLSFDYYTRIIDCGNGPRSDNIIISISYLITNQPFAHIYRGNTSQIQIKSPYSLQKNTWTHLAVIYDNDSQNFMLYMNGTLVANSTSPGPLGVTRTQCYIGRSDWHAVKNESDVSACFDDLMLYNRALTPNEIQASMNTYFY